MNKLKNIVYILPEVKVKIDSWVMFAKGEVSGLGLIRPLKKGVLLVEDVFLLDQVCTGQSTVLNQNAIVKLMSRLIGEGADMSLLRFWWHSHAKMDTFWSPRDNETIIGFQNSWMVSLVTNYYRNYLCRVDSFDPVHMTSNRVTFDVLLEVSEEQLSRFRDEVDSKVKYVKPAQIYSKLYPHVVVSAEGVKVLDEYNSSENGFSQAEGVGLT